jgi:hypothetical protein
LNWSAAAALVAACAVVGGAIVASGACIPDLPSSSAAPTALCGDSVIELDAGETCDPGQGTGDASIGNCANCRVQCPGGLIWRNNHCYELTPSFFNPSNGLTSPVSAPYLNLSQFCRAGHVVTFSGEEEFQAVASFFDASPFWVGLETAPTSPATPTLVFPPTASRYVSVASFEPGWQTMCRGCYAHTTDPNAPLPESLDASTDGSAEDCVIAWSADQDAAWHQYPCSSFPLFRPPFSITFPPRTICEVEPVGYQWRECEAGICVELVETYGKKRYVYGAKAVSANDAENACATLGGRLVVLQSAEEREQLWRELSRVPLAGSGRWGVWIGLKRIDGNRFAPPTWQWDDGIPDDGTYPSPWGAGQGQGQALGGSTRRAFLQHSTPPGPDDTLAHDDQPATTMLPYVCEIAVGPNDAGAD